VGSGLAAPRHAERAGAWLVTRLPRRETLPAVSALACAAVVAVMFGIGVASFHQMVGSPFGGARIIRACPGPARIRTARCIARASRPGAAAGPPSGRPAAHLLAARPPRVSAT
jgi:hypothetical protein